LLVKYENKKKYFFLRVTNFIYSKESLMLLKNYVVAFILFILQEFNNTQEELIGEELILILLDIKLLFGNDLSIIIYFGYFS